MIQDNLYVSRALFLAGQSLSLPLWACGTDRRPAPQTEVCVFWADNESCMKLADNPSVHIYAATDGYTEMKYNNLFKTCLILFKSPLSLLALCHSGVYWPFGASLLTVGAKITPSQAFVQIPKMWGTWWLSNLSLDFQDELRQTASTVPASAALWTYTGIHPKHLCTNNILAGPTWQCTKSARLPCDNVSRPCLYDDAEMIPQCSLQSWSKTPSGGT